MSKTQDDPELEKKLKEQARQRAREKAQKKRREEKEMKIFKETNQEFQRKINENRTDYGLPKKKLQKTMRSYFKK